MTSLQPVSPNMQHGARVALLLVATVLCYAWGLDSPLLFDDLPNLGALAFIDNAPVFNAGFREFVLGGDSGPTGRPVALFTFALQAAAWPDHPLAFKAVNLFIHCVNAILVYGISARLLGLLRADDRDAGNVALCIALVWALHPVHTATVLYAVQRMALLSNGFMLAGVYAWLHARVRLQDATPMQLVPVTLVLFCCGVLAMLSKENAASLVFYLLTLEYTLLHGLQPNPVWRRWRLVCLWFPACLLLLLPLLFLPALQADYLEHYTFTPWQRLLTESRVLWQYLAVLLLPVTAAIGIFHDVTVSTSLVAPLSTFLAILAWGACIAVAIWKPDRNRLLPFALCWFLSGHIVESTILPLELFFHHRNYLAFFGVIFSVVYVLRNLAPIRNRHWQLPVILLYLALLGLHTASTSKEWSRPLVLAERWYEAAPHTPRNADFYAIQLAALGRNGEELAAAVFRQAIAAGPDNLRLQLNLMILACVNGAIEPPRPADVFTGINNLTPASRDLVSPVQQLVNLHMNGNCPGTTSDFFVTMLERLIAATRGYDRGMFQFDLARLHQHLGDRDQASDLLDAAWTNTGDAGVLVLHAIVLGESGRFGAALDMLDMAIGDISRHNDIRTGTRRSKLQAIGELRQRTVAAMNANNSEP